MSTKSEERSKPSSETKVASPTEAQQKAAAQPSRREVPEAADSLEQLREILFGAIYRELERRLTRGDAHLVARANELEQEARRRTEVLEAHVRQEIETLAGRLERELIDRAENTRSVAREHRESVTALEQRVAKVEDTLVRAQREIRQQLLEQAKSFLDEIQRVRHEIAETLERELGEVAEYGEEERPSP
jgi:hypothetical protein